MFKTRLISGILLLLVTVLIVARGGFLLLGVLCTISLIGMSELFRIFKIRRNYLGGAGYLVAIAYYILLLVQKGESITFLTILYMILLMVIYVFTFPKFRSEQVQVAFFGLFYVAVMLSYVFQVRALEGGGFAVWLIFLSAWGCDTCAYCVGMLFGKHKMAPKLSPKKSVEGGIGGIVGAAILGGIYAALINHYGDAGVSIISYALICGVGGMISQVGDLAASAIKRNHEIKDYGTLIPGHGGILDRFDSVIFTAPIIYYMAIFFIS
jgi:CDP-diglyceride synthetase